MPNQTTHERALVPVTDNPAKRDSTGRIPSPPRSHYRQSLVCLFGVLVCGILVCSGCQSLHPFTHKTQQRVAVSRQWNSGGLEAYQKGRLDRAEEYFTRAADQTPNDFRVRANLARTMYRNGNHPSAILNMQQAVDLSGGDPELAVELGEMYLNSGQWLSARRQVDLALESNHRFAPAWVLSGKTEKSKGNYQHALADFHKALGYSPDLPDVQMQIVDTYQKLNQPLQALSAVEQILSRHSALEQPEEAVIAKSEVLMAMNQTSTAIDLLQTASQNENASSQVFVRLSQAQLAANQISQSRLTLNRGKLAFPQESIFDQMAVHLKSEEQRVAMAKRQDASPHY